MEIRTIKTELRAEKPQGKTPEDQQQEQPEKTEKDNIISGYALTFNKESKDLGGFVEVIDPKALDGVALDNVIMLYDHDYSKPVASVKNGTLKLETDEKGLKFTATLDDTVSYISDLVANIKNGNVNDMSFRFDIEDGSDEFTTDGEKTVRTIKQIKDLYEVSAVTIGAYDDPKVKAENNDTKEAVRSYENYLNENKKEAKNMAEITLNNQNTETRAFEDYIRSQGEVRSVTTGNTPETIPSEVLKPVFQLKQSKFNLAKYATVKAVSGSEGHYPIAANLSGVTLLTKEEAKNIEDVDAEMFNDVPYHVATRAGKISLSNEVVADSAVNIVEEVKNQLQHLVDNTDNKNILDLLQGKDFKQEEVSTIDDIKKAFNVELAPELDKKFYISQSAFQVLDTMKDADDRYLLQPNPTMASGYSILGAEVVIVADKLLPGAKMILGDLAQAVAVFRNTVATAQWDQFDSYSQGLSVVLRSDYGVIDKDAAIVMTVKAAEAPKE